jgi:hypothetical protein
VPRRSAKVIGAKPVNTTRRYVTSRGKLAETEKISLGIVMDGIATVMIAIVMIVIDFA